MVYARSQTCGKRGEGGVPHPPQAPTSAERVPLPLLAPLRAPFYGPVESGRSRNAPVLSSPAPGRPGPPPCPREVQGKPGLPGTPGLRVPGPGAERLPGAGLAAAFP